MTRVNYKLNYESVDSMVFVISKILFKFRLYELKHITKEKEGAVSLCTARIIDHFWVARMLKKLSLVI